MTAYETIAAQLTTLGIYLEAMALCPQPLCAGLAETFRKVILQNPCLQD